MIVFGAEASEEVRAAAADACDIPQKHLGRDVEGTDCAGCAQLVYARFAIDCRLPLNYPMRWWTSNPSRLISHLDMLGWRKVLFGAAVPLDLLVFALASKLGDHCGVFTGRERFVHCWAERSQESLLTDEIGRTRWLNRLVGVYRPHRPPIEPTEPNRVE